MSALITNTINMKNIGINEIEEVIKSYLNFKHPNHSNGFIIRLEDHIKNSYNRRRSYIIKFPHLHEETDKKNDQIIEILNTWTDFAINNIVPEYDLNYEMTILSIDPLNIDKQFKSVSVQYSGTTVNPEDFIRSISFDIIDQMNKHLIETYMDEKHPDIDIEDSDQRDQFNAIFDEIDMESIYETYPYSEVYVPINLTNSEADTNCELYLNATLKTNYQMIDIIDDIRRNLDTDDTNEVFNYNKDDIVYKFRKNKELENFAIITDAVLSTS
jgi:hypothetical protein